jgi:hypothetical protein
MGTSLETGVSLVLTTNVGKVMVVEVLVVVVVEVEELFHWF